MAERSVVVRLRADIADYTAKLSVAGRVTQDLERKVARATGRTAQGYHQLGVGMVAAGGLVVAGLGVAAKAAADFDEKMALVRTLSRATPTEMAKLRNSALSVGQAYGYSADEVADAEAELVKAGVSVSDILSGALVGSLTLAAAGQTDVASATEVATIAMTQFGLTGKDIPHVADLLAAGADKALGSVADLAYALDQGGPQAAQFNVSLEETVGTLAAFANAGQIGERGGTVFSQMLLQLSNPSHEASELMKQLGIDVYDAGGEFVGMAGLAGQLQGKLSGLSHEERTHALAVIFGARAIRGANILYQQGEKGIERWTERVDESGFAALQAAGKMDNLNGDLTKFRTALTAAFIQAGGSAQGPLRELVQDATAMVEWWTKLPAPIRNTAEALTIAGAAAAVLGGAALILIPKLAATRAALADLPPAAGRAARALGKGGVLVGGAMVATAVVSGLDEALGGVSYSADGMTASLTQLGITGQITGELSRAFGSDLADLHSKLSLSGDGVDIFGFKFHSLGQMFTHSGSDFSNARRAVDGVDQALAGLVTSGNADIASKAWERLVAAAKAQGVSVDDLVAKFPEYSGALAESGASADAAGHGVDQYGNAVDRSAAATEKATEKIKAYSDALHAQYDPLFAMNQALQDHAEKQKAAAKATAKYGADSKQAHQANLALAQSTMELEGSANALARQWSADGVTMSKAREQLRGWVKDGLLTKKQADDILTSFANLIGKAKEISGIHAKMTVLADTMQAEGAITHFLTRLANAESQPHVIHVKTVGDLLTGPTKPSPKHRADGGLITGPGTGTSDDIPAWLSNGEFVMPAASTAKHLPLLEAMRAGRFAGGGLVGAHTTRGNVIDQLHRIINSPRSSTVQIARALDALDKLSTAWQATVAEINQAAQQRGLQHAVDKAKTQLEKARKETGDTAKADVHSATQQLHQARKALEEFHKQAELDRKSRRLAAATARLQARQTLEANREAFTFDRMSIQEQLDYLDRRMAKEKKYSDQWISDAQQRRQILDSQRQAAQTIADYVNPAEKTGVGFAPSISQLISNGAGQVQQLTEWLEQLDLAKHRHLSHAAIVMLGLDSPEGLAQLLQVNKGTDAEIAELNAIARARAKLGKAGAKVTLYDSGGVWPSGTIGLNMSGRDEYVLPPGARPQLASQVPAVHVYVGDREITDIVRVEIGKDRRAKTLTQRRQTDH